MKEVCRLLRSSKTLFLKVERSPEATDVSHRYKQQLRLLSLCRRSLAFSVGRGMLTLSSLDPLMAEHLPIPPLALSGQSDGWTDGWMGCPQDGWSHGMSVAVSEFLNHTHQPLSLSLPSRYRPDPAHQRHHQLGHRLGASGTDAVA